MVQQLIILRSKLNYVVSFSFLDIMILDIMILDIMIVHKVASA